MDKLEQYRHFIKILLSQYAQHKPLNPKIEREFIGDTEHDRYLIVNLGWEGQRHVYGCTIHIEIRDGKIWIQQNMTEADLAEELVAMGVPKHDIVLGFHSPFKRQFTEYAVG